MSNKDKKETESPEIIEDIIPGKNNNNNDQASNNKYDIKESAESVIKDLQETNRSIERNTDEARNQKHSYDHQAIADTHEQITKATNGMAENYLDYKKQAINSFQSVFMPYFGNIHNQFWNNQDFFRRMQETYSMMFSIYTENIIALNRIFNNILFSNVGLFKNSFNEPTEQSKHLA